MKALFLQNTTPNYSFSSDQKYDLLVEYEKAKNKFINLLCQTDERLPEDYLNMALQEALAEVRNYHNEAFK